MGSPPKRFHLSDFGQDLGPIWSQGQSGSCWAVALSGACDLLARVSGNHSGGSFKYSPQNMINYFKLNNKLHTNGGLFIGEAVQYLVQVGIGLEDSWPYRGLLSENDPEIHRTGPVARPIRGYELYDCEHEQWNSPSFWNNYLLNKFREGIVILDMKVGHAFKTFRPQDSETGIYKFESEFDLLLADSFYKHSMLAVGYDDDDRTHMPYFDIRNSWGTNWAHNGTAKISRDPFRIYGVLVLFPSSKYDPV